MKYECKNCGAENNYGECDYCGNGKRYNNVFPQYREEHKPKKPIIEYPSFFNLMNFLVLGLFVMVPYYIGRLAELIDARLVGETQNMFFLWFFGIAYITSFVIGLMLIVGILAFTKELSSDIREYVNVRRK